MPRHCLSIAVHLLLFFCWLICAYGQSAQPAVKLMTMGKPAETRAGLLTDRLSSRELEKWRTIENIVFAEDQNHQPWHPTLRGLWEWIEASGHTVYVEVARSNRIATCTAGTFTIERFDPRGERHVAVIKLNLANIDQAFVGEATRRADGFIPFAKLNRTERYAEVLGHELAHAVHILTNLERSRVVEDVVQQTNQLLLSHHARRREASLTQDLKRRLTKRDSFLKELEAQAEAMEKVVWDELIRSKGSREKLPDLAEKP